jgi:hypothetical protein
MLHGYLLVVTVHVRDSRTIGYIYMYRSAWVIELDGWIYIHTVCTDLDTRMMMSCPVG